MIENQKLDVCFLDLQVTPMLHKERAKFPECSCGIASRNIVVAEQSVHCWIVWGLLLGIRQNTFSLRFLTGIQVCAGEGRAGHGIFRRQSNGCPKLLFRLPPAFLPLV